MIASWMVYTVLVGGLIGIGALAAERAFLLLRRPVRWIWTSALALSILIPCLGGLLPTNAAVPPGIERVMVRTANLVVPRALPESVAVGSVGFPYEKALLVGWAAASLGLAHLLLYSLAVLRGRRREWRREIVNGVEALIAPDFGPAVVGWRRLEIVLPSWVMTLTDDARALVVSHERQHLLERDPRRLIHALLAVLAMPWNPALWWQYRRLRRAIELDCDARVILGGASVARYGEVLLEAGGLCRRGALPALAAFSERAGDLEARIRALTPLRGRWRGARVGAAIAGAGFLMGAAGIVPNPLAQSKPVAVPVAAAAGTAPEPDLGNLAIWAKAQIGEWYLSGDLVLFRTHEGKFLGSQSLSKASARLAPALIESISILKGPRYGIPHVGAVAVITLKAGEELPAGMDDSFREYVSCSTGDLHVGGVRMIRTRDLGAVQCY